jgi:hypothetical protein
MKIIRLLFFLLPFVTQAQEGKSPVEQAFSKNSKKQLLSFFVNWHKELPTFSDSAISSLSDTQKQAYKIFTAFYKPHRLDSLVGGEWDYATYDKKQFLLVQNDLQIQIIDKFDYSEKEINDFAEEHVKREVKNDSLREAYLKRNSEGYLQTFVLRLYSPERYTRISDSIHDFRPLIRAGGKTPLYLSEKYMGMLNDFLASGNNYYMIPTVANLAPPDAETKKRIDFLEHYIKIWYGHWAGDWQLVSYPYVYSIVFDKELKNARVNFRMVYERGQAIMKYENGKWVLKSSRTWVQ